MKRPGKITYIFLLLIALTQFASDVKAQQSDTNKHDKTEFILLDSELNEPVMVAFVTIGDENFVCNQDAKIQVPNRLLRNEKVAIECFGYEKKEIRKEEYIGKRRVLVRLKPVKIIFQEVTITGDSKKTTQNSIVQRISESEIKKSLGTTLAASLEKVKGVSTIQSGTTISKPVIHGMYSNRILIINNGVRQQGQQWGDDHAPEVDMNNAGSISVIKGAEAVKYGSEALGGVVKLESKLLPYGRYGVKGNFSEVYATNGKRHALTGHIEGAHTKLSDFAWRLQSTYINAGDRRAANYVINNTGMREFDLSAALGFRKRDYGVEAFYSYYSTKIGVFFNAHASNVELLKEKIAMGRPLEVEPFSRSISYPYQDVKHHLGKVNAFYNFRNNSTVSLQYSIQTDHRNEYHQRRGDRSSTPSTALDLFSSQLDVNWKKELKRGWNTDIGAFYGYTNNKNIPGTGVVPIIPNYVQNNVGVYGLQKYATTKWGVEVGARFDYQTLDANGIDIDSRRYGGKTNYSNFTYNIGGNYNIGKQIRLVSNLGMAWRAPHVHELYSNGLDHASGTYSVGDSKMKGEQSTKWITSASYDNKYLSVSVDGYLQWVKNFIYDEPSKEFIQLISGSYPVFRYKQVNAFFRGVDAEVSITPLKGLKFDAMASMIWVNETHTNRYLPYIPSFRYNQSVGYFFANGKLLKGSYIKLKHRFVDKQRRFDPESDLIPFSPEAYNLFGFEIGTNINIGHRHKISLMVDADNIFNKEYKEYTNRFRYYSHDLGRDIRFMLTYEF